MYIENISGNFNNDNINKDNINNKLLYQYIILKSNENVKY